MRRILAAAAVLLLILLAWFLLSDHSGRVDEDHGVADGAASKEAEAAHAKDKRPARARPGERSDDEGGSGFYAQWPQVGQDRPQDPKLAAIRGTVLCAMDFAASEAVIEASLRGDVTARGRVAERGAFLLKNVPPGRGIGLTARAEGYAPGGFDKLILTAGQILDVGPIYLGGALDPDADNRIEVHVVKAGGGGGVAGAVVTATSTLSGALVALGPWEKQPGGTVARTKTDDKGVAIFEKLPSAFYDVFAEAEGLTFVLRQRLIIQRDTKMTIDLEVAPALTIEGKVLDAEGKPLADVRLGALRLGNFTMNPATSSGEDGAFTISGLAAGSYWIFAAKQGYGQKDVQNVEAGKKDLQIVIPQGGGIAIRVVDAAKGEPIRDFAVRPFRNQPFAYLYSPRLDLKTEDGVWRQQLDKGNWGVEVSAAGYALRTLPTVPLDAKDPVEVRLDPAGVVHGRVVAKSGGGPVRGARVYVKRGGMPPSPVKDLQTATDPSGEFVLDHLPRVATKVTISHVDFSEQAFDVEPVARSGDGTLPPVQEFALGGGGRVEGHAFGPGHASAAGQQLTLMKGFDFSTMRQATVAADGAFSFRNVPPDTYTLTLGQPFAGGTTQRNDVQVTEGGVVVVDFGTDTGGKRVTGRVQRGGEPVTGLPLILEGPGGSSNRATSDAQGRFVFENVAAGSYRLRPLLNSSASTQVVVQGEDPPAEVELELPAVGSIEGRVVDDTTGKPLSGVFLNWQQTADAAGPLADVRGGPALRPTSEDGKFSVTGLEAGRYTIRAFRDPYGAEVADDLALGPGEARTGIEIRLVAAGSLSGVAKTAAGKAVEGASVQIRDARGRRVFLISFANTSADGTFLQGQLRPGEYDVTLEKEGFAPSTKHVVITVNNETKAKFAMLMGGRIDVTAKKADGSVASGARAALLDASGKAVERGLTMQNIFGTSQRTDAEGKITLRGVAAGDYQVKVTLDDGTSNTQAVTVVDGAPTTVEIRLGP